MTEGLNSVICIAPVPDLSLVKPGCLLHTVHRVHGRVHLVLAPREHETLLLGIVLSVTAREDAGWFGGSCLPADQSVAGTWLGKVLCLRRG